MDFLLSRCKRDDGYLLFHCFTNNEAKFPAFLDDFAFLIAALIHLQEISANAGYLVKARQYTEYVLEHFNDGEGGTFYYTNHLQRDVVIRKKEVYDGATPSGNAIMAFNLLYLSVVFDLPEWKNKAIVLCSGLQHAIMNYPSSFANWATLMQALTYVIPEIVMVGKKIDSHKACFLRDFTPFRIFQAANQQVDAFPLLMNKPVLEQTQIYLCRNYACELPITEVEELREKLIEIREN